MRRENLERNFGFILNDVARLLRKVYDRRVRSLGLTRSQWWVVTHLYRSEGVTQSELADILEVERATLGRLLDRLEDKGWIRRQADPRDRRAKRVYLTEQIEEPMRTMRRVAANLRGDALAGLSAAEQERFVDTLLKIKDNLIGLEDGGTNNANARRREARK